jgi:predicted SprT family Zn-dependent metalloprotease
VIEWSARLTQTAGRTHYSVRKTDDEDVYEAKIELASKVLDDEHKLRNTLAHEMCHVAVWILEKDGTPHGDAFKRWGYLNLI